MHVWICIPNIQRVCLRVKHDCVCIVGVKLPRVLSLAPRRNNTGGSLTPSIYVQSCLIPIITRCHLFFYVAANILLTKSNSKFESRAISIRVAVSPCNLGGKYHSRLHPLVKCACGFCGRPSEWNRTAPDWLHLLTTTLIMRCVWRLNFICTLPFPTKMATSTQQCYIHAPACRYIFQRDLQLAEALPFVQARVTSWSDDVTLRSCANFKCVVANVNKQIRIDFWGVKCVSGENDQPYRENLS